MSTDQTTNIGLPFLMPAQAQKHVTLNESMTRLDALVQASVKSRSLSVQPGSPGDGERWICPTGKTGPEWGGYADGALAYYRDGAWEQMQPKAGWRVWIEDEALFVIFDGAEWMEPPRSSGFRNLIINGCFRVWQRGTSFTGATTWTADRWRYRYPNTGAATVSRQAFPVGQTDVPGEPEFFVNVTRLGDSAWFGHYVEDVRRLAGRSVTISGYAKAASACSIPVKYSQDFGVAGSPNVQSDFGSIDLTTSWAPFKFTATVPSIAGKTIGDCDYTKICFGQAGSDNVDVDFALIQLEEGPAATPFEIRPIACEETICKRYYERWIAETAYASFATGHCDTATQMEAVLRYAVPKRAAPTFGSGGSFRVDPAGGGIDVMSFNAVHATTHGLRLECNVASGLTAGEAAGLISYNDASAYLEFDAEL